MTRLVLAWIVTAVVATAAGVALLGLLGGALTGGSGRTMTQAEARAALAAVTPRPTATGSATSGPESPTLLRTAGGTIVASCAESQVTLRSWSPAQGYSADDVEPGPAAVAKVEFETEQTDLDVEVRCGPGGVPVASVVP